MEILIAAVVALVSQGLKKLEARIGGNATLILVFVLCFIGTLVWTKLQVNFADFVQHVIVTFGVAIGVYEVILKKIPAIGKREE